MNNNSQNIEQGRTVAMENYVDFNGSSKKNWVGTTSEFSRLDPATKTKYMFVAGAVSLTIIGSGIYGVVLSKKHGGGFWRGVGYFLLFSIPTGFVLNLATMSYQQRIATAAATPDNGGVVPPPPHYLPSPPQLATNTSSNDYGYYPSPPQLATNTSSNDYGYYGY